MVDSSKVESQNLTQINIEIEVYERLISDYEDLLAREYQDGNDFIEDRVFKLNCKYADLLVQRADIMDTIRTSDYDFGMHLRLKSLTLRDLK